jgi:hypothetical protein
LETFPDASTLLAENQHFPKKVNGILAVKRGKGLLAINIGEFG